MADEPEPLGKLYRERETGEEVFVLRDCRMVTGKGVCTGIVYYRASDANCPVEWIVTSQEVFDQCFELAS